MAHCIVLVRHGPSALTVRGRQTRDGILQHRAAYDRAGIQPNFPPPASLRHLAANAGTILSSDLTRAIESSGQLAGERSVTTSPLLREIPLRIPQVAGRLPIAVWEALIHLHWFHDIARGRDLAPDARAQVRDAADWLIAHAHASMVIAVTHGVLRRAIAHRLTALGWQRTRTDGRYQPWSAWFFELTE